MAAPTSTTPRAPSRRARGTGCAALLVGLLVLLGACASVSALTELHTDLEDEGFRDVSANISPSNASMMVISADAPSDTEVDEAQTQAAEVVWTTFPRRFEALRVTIDGDRRQWTYAELQDDLGDRPSSLDTSKDIGDDLTRSVVYVILGLLVAAVVAIAAIAVTVVLVMRANRRKAALRPRPTPQPWMPPDAPGPGPQPPAGGWAPASAPPGPPTASGPAAPLSLAKPPPGQGDGPNGPGDGSATDQGGGAAAPSPDGTGSTTGATDAGAPASDQTATWASPAPTPGRSEQVDPGTSSVPSGPPPSWGAPSGPGPQAPDPGSTGRTGRDPDARRLGRRPRGPRPDQAHTPPGWG